MAIWNKLIFLNDKTSATNLVMISRYENGRALPRLQLHNRHIQKLDRKGTP